jgi:hypothetical protein
MNDAERYAFTAADGVMGETGLMPQLPMTLTYQGCSIDVVGLLDTGATVNVLPYRLGLQLRAIWESESATIRLGGNLARYDACPLIVFAAVGSFHSVRLAFAWTQADDIPLILGQVNFFMEFDVCFYRSQQAFDIRPRL